MPGQQDGLLRQIQDFPGYTLHQCSLIPTGKMCQTEAVFENGIADKGHIVLGTIIEHAIRCMAGNMMHGQRKCLVCLEGNLAPVRQIIHIIQFDI